MNYGNHNHGNNKDIASDAEGHTGEGVQLELDLGI